MTVVAGPDGKPRYEDCSCCLIGEVGCLASVEAWTKLPSVGYPVVRATSAQKPGSRTFFFSAFEPPWLYIASKASSSFIITK
jgi:hypothetical protein